MIALHMLVGQLYVEIRVRFGPPYHAFCTLDRRHGFRLSVSLGPFGLFYDWAT